MVRFLAVAAALVLGVAVPAAGQTETIAADRVALNAGCDFIAGSGSPEGAVVAPACSMYLRTSDSTWWRKASGAGNTGWVQDTLDVPITVPLGGTGTTSFTANGVLFGNGTSAVQVTGGPGANTVLAANSGAPSFTSWPTVDNVNVTSTVYADTVSTSTISSGGNIDLDPDGDNVLPATAYLVNLGALNRKWLTLHVGELWASQLVAADVMSTIGGRVVVAPTTRLTANISGSDSSISVEHNSLASGDRVLMESGGQVEWMAVTSGASGSGPYSYNVTRNLDASGANSWLAGDAVLNTGTTGDGLIDLYATSGVLPGSTAGPTMVGNVRTGTTYSDLSPRWAIGNLNGLYGYGSDTYGAAFGNPSAAWLKIDATNGVRIGHDATTLTSIDAAGNASFRGSLTSTSGTIGGWTLGASSLTATNVGLYSGAANAARVQVGTGSNIGGLNSCNSSSDIGLWLGNTHANRASAPFRVTCGGSVVAGNVEIDTVTGNMGIGDGPISAGRLNIASPDDTVNSYGLIVSNASGSQVNFVAYGNGRSYMNGPLYFGSVVYDTTGASSNSTMILNGPFGSGVQMAGWIQVFVNGVQRWMPVW